MWTGSIFGIFVFIITLTYAQLPPRLQIPGAIPISGPRQAPLRQQRINVLNTEFIPRPRRPPPSAPIRDVRPVIEEEDDYPPSQSGSISSFDNEVNKLSISAVTSEIRRNEEEELQQQQLRPSPTPFRPEKPVPITRDQIRERTVSEFPRPAPIPQARPIPVARQESRPRPARPAARQELDFDEEENIPRQPIRPKVRPQSSQQAFRPAPRPKQKEEEYNGPRKPVVQILRKYRTDNEDGSITWGFENEDGTFKEETLGTDCTIKGKYGYVDPDGVKREFEYEAGNKCDPNQVQEEDLDDEPEFRPRNPPPQKKQTSSRPQQAQPQIQYRPQLAQY